MRKLSSWGNHPCPGPTQSRPAAYDSGEIGNSKPTRCCERRTGSASGGIQKLGDGGNVDSGHSGAADEGEMGVVCCKHRLAAATAADCDHGTHAGSKHHAINCSF